LLVLLRQDLNQLFRIRRTEGKRTEQESTFKRLRPLLFAVLIGAAIIWAILSIVPLFGWSSIALILLDNLDIGATLFNFILIISLIGSIMVSATTVGNSQRMEYLLTMPLAMRTVFLEKTIVVILNNAVLFLGIGVPVFIGLSIVSAAPLAFLSVVVFVVLILSLVTIGVSLGGLCGLLFSRLLAGRRTLKQVGWFLASSLSILVIVLYYYTLYTSNGSGVFEWLFELARSLGLSSRFTPGYPVSTLSLGILIGVPPNPADVLTGVVFIAFGLLLAHANSYVSELAHYSGWLASGSKRTSVKDVRKSHALWNPQPIPGFQFNQTVSVSIWYNISSIRREGRVLAQYLMGPIRFVIFLVLPFVAVGELAMEFTPYFILAAVVPFAVSYGVYFAGYETVYEGRNLMTLQLAATNMADYVKGKVISAIPFVLITSIAISVLLFFVGPVVLPYLFGVPIACVFITLAAGAIAANAAAIGGDFRAERSVLRQRGAAVQMPIRGWSMLRAQLIPYVLGYIGIYSMVGVGLLVSALYGAVLGVVAGYAVIGLFGLVCYSLYNHYSHSAGVKLAQMEASKYL